MASEEMGAQMENDSTVLTSLFHQFVPQVGRGGSVKVGVMTGRERLLGVGGGG